MYIRVVKRRAIDALLDTPVVLIIGPRLSGKTTLVRSLQDTERAYVTLDDQTTLDAASYRSSVKSSNVNAKRSFTEGLVFITGNVLGVRANCVFT